ncbi:MAG: sugar phosphate isomerase/epimerase family protein [Phycisphaerales bacterium]
MARTCPPIALQLFSIRDRTETDLLGALDEVAEIGYEAVEFAGLFDHEVSRVRKKLDACGMRACASHIALSRLHDEFDACVDEVRTLGAGYVVIPYLAEDQRGPAGYPEAAAEMVNLAKRLREHDLQLAYHHHNFEFQPVSGDTPRRGIDDILDTSEDLVKLEIDVYWARHGGVNPIFFLRRQVHRSPLLHLKDMRDEQSKRFAEIGAGILDFRQIVTIAIEHGVEWLIVEQDSDFAVSSRESARQSYEALRRLCREIVNES